MARFGTIGTQYFDSAGDPLASGLLYFYESGTTTAKATYVDENLTIANTNPVVLNADGTQPNIFYDGTAKVILTDSDYVQIDQKDPVGGDSSQQLGAWSVTSVYGQFDFVTGSNGCVYKSVSSGNQGNDPTSDDGSSWAKIKQTVLWQSPITFVLHDVVQGSDGLLYVSLIASNQGNDPVSDAGTKWGDPTKSKSTYEEFLTSGTFVKSGWSEYIYVECVGGGGAGGNGAAGSGGSGGGFISKLYRASELTSSEAVTVGAGGVNSGVGSGSAGGATSFGTSVLLSVSGGLGGNTVGSTTTTNPAGSFQLSNAQGSDAPAFNVGTLDSGYGGGAGGYAGGDALKGGAGGGGSPSNKAGGTSMDGGDGGDGSAAGAAGNGSVPGGGGGGSGSNTGSNGGNGGGGRVRVWQW